MAGTLTRTFERLPDDHWATSQSPEVNYVDHTQQLDDPDAEILVEAVKREPLFEALQDGPQNLRELDGRLDMSRSTIHRTTQSFIECGLVSKSDETFELSGLGTHIAAELATFRSRIGSLQRLGPFLNTIESTDVDVPIEHFDDAVVAVPTAGQPHVGVRRIIEGIEASESLRMFSSIISPIYVDAAKREMENGTDITVVFDAELVDIISTEYYADAQEAFDTGNFDVYVHDDVPFELFVFDDAMGMAAHDENGIARAYVETDAPAAIEWAESLYEAYERDAEYANPILD